MVTTSLGMSATAQSGDMEALTQLLGEEKISYIQENHPDRLPYMAFLNRNGYRISESTADKDLSQYPNALEVGKVYADAEDLTISLFQGGELNLLGYNFPIDKEEFNYFRVGSSNLVLTILPEKIIQERFKR